MNKNKNKRFVFIIPSYNNIDWYRDNIKSVVGQTYQNWRVIYVDDCSTDGTLERVKQLVRTTHPQYFKRFTFIQNSQRRFQSYSRYIAYQTCDDDEICILLDGDDWLADT